MKIIDGHVHLFERVTGYGFAGGVRAVGEGKIETDAGISLTVMSPELGDKGVLAEDFLRFMDEHGIEKAVAMQSPAYGIHNLYLKEVMDRYPDRFLGAAMIDPEITLFDQVLNHLVFDLGFRVIKLETSQMGGTQGGHAQDVLSHPNIDRLFEAMSKVGGTVAIDMGKPEESSFQLDRLIDLVNQYPDVKVVACHVLKVTGKEVDRLPEWLGRLKADNVYTDISALLDVLGEKYPFNLAKKVVNLAVDILGADRVIWGSDTPMTLLSNSYEEMLNGLVLENEHLTDEQKQMIIHDNALQAFPFSKA